MLDSVGIPEENLAEDSFLLLAPRAWLRKAANELVAWLAAKGDVFILDGGNSFDAYGVIRTISRHAKPQLPLYLARVHTARSFTCYQTLALSTQAKNCGYPVVALNITQNFNDENVLYEERRFLFQACLETLLGLNHRLPLVFLEVETRLGRDSVWLSCLKETVHHVFHLQQPVAAQQLTLF